MDEKQKIERALELACEYIDEMRADCPYTANVYEFDDCDGCEDKITTECWKKYFLEKADK